ncbi:hypothetical protein E2C01_090483 [Portunus trituberculatus]|uniref:Secreted protein n=1 Tax=Portunus trituberculatus TaxID=210409 RepID=A0A5B7JBI9_PORTR|nr:hypothetical protein [Portunus trituberculatus]
MVVVVVMMMVVVVVVVVVERGPVVVSLTHHPACLLSCLLACRTEQLACFKEMVTVEIFRTGVIP